MLIFTRNGHTAVFQSPIMGAGNEYKVQEVERRDYRPHARHYGYRFATVKSVRNRTVAEKMMLNMRTDARAVRLLTR